MLDEDNDFDLIHTQGIDSSISVNLYCRECGRKWSAMLKSQVKKTEAVAILSPDVPITTLSNVKRSTSHSVMK